MAAHEHVDGKQEELAKRREYRLPRQREEPAQLRHVAARERARHPLLPAAHRRAARHRQPLLRPAAALVGAAASTGPIACEKRTTEK